VLQGLYKFWFETSRGSGSGVMFATPGGKLYGGNSGSSLVGSYTEKDGVYSSELIDVASQPRSELCPELSDRQRRHDVQGRASW